MAIDITLYAFSKRENSTKLPDIAGYTISGEIKHGCSIVAPVIHIKNAGLLPLNYNYCYIPSFKRYYYINDWTIEGGIWSASLNVDALASWRSNILNSSEYVLRNSKTYDNSIIDNFYSTKSKVTKQMDSVTFFDGTNLSTGSFIVGILGGGTLGVTYYLMTLTQFQQIINKLTDDPTYLDIKDISNELVKGLVNPFQYFTRAYFLPFGNNWIGGISAPDVQVGWWKTGVSCNRIKEDNTIGLSKSFTIPKHPQASSRGVYLNGAPFSRYSINFMPFGNIVLDANLLKDATTLNVNTYTDVLTGDTILKIYADDVIVGTASANVSASIPLSSVTSNVGGMVTSLVGAASSFLMGDYLSTAGNVGNALDSALPQANTRGSQGGFMTAKEQCSLISEFYELVPEDLEHRGRPLCQKKTLSTLTGYTVVADADLKAPCTRAEIQTIKNYMEGGFYIE